MTATTASQRMAAIREARADLAEARRVGEARMREQLNQELAPKATLLDIRIREAVAAGDRVAEVMRAYPTKDRRTIVESLARTEDMAVEVRDSAYADRYSLEGNVLTVTYDSYGPDQISGTAQFDVDRWDDGTFFLQVVGSFETGDVIEKLDGVTEGYYHDDVSNFLGEEYHND